MSLIGLLVPYETHTVALEKQLEGTRIPRESDPHTKVSLPPLKMVASRRKHTSGPTITPLSHDLQIFTDHQKKGGVLT